MITKEKVGFWTILSLVVGNMIGAGIFTIPASLAKYGSISLLSWSFTGAGAILLALVFSRLATKHPAVGGPYAYCHDAFGDYMGFQVAWTYWISMWVGSVATIVMTVGYISVFIPSLNNNPNLSFLTGLIIIWSLTLLNIKSVKASGFVQILTTILKILPIFIVVAFAIPEIDVANFEPFNATDSPNITAFMTASTITMWTFIGLESATIPSDNIENPKRIIPLATVIGTLFVALLYIGTVAIIDGMIPNDILQNSPAPFATVAEKLFGSTGGWLIAFGAVFAALGSLNGFVLIQAQVPLAAAKDKLFPVQFGKQNKKGIPNFALIINATIMSIILYTNYNKSLINQFTLLATLATLAALTTYMFSTVAEMVLHVRHKYEYKNERKMHGAMIISMLAFAYTIWAIIGAGEEIVYMGALLFFGSTPIYALIKWQHTR
jgi:APA family basic amino acid/polyamine antiporter